MLSSCWILYIVATFFLAGSVTIVVGQKPSNDRCIDSITLVEGDMVNGDNSRANYDYNNQGVCGPRSDRRAVWYEINGVGLEVTVSVCTNNDKITDFGIFRACNTQNCLGAPPQETEAANCDEQETNSYSFLAKDGESYYVHVRSDVVFEGEGSNFTIWYTEPDVPTSTPVALPGTLVPVPVPLADGDGSPSSSSSQMQVIGFQIIVSIAAFLGLSLI